MVQIEIEVKVTGGEINPPCHFNCRKVRRGRLDIIQRSRRRQNIRRRRNLLRRSRRRHPSDNRRQIEDNCRTLRRDC